MPLRHQQDHFFLSLAVRESLDPSSDRHDAFDVLARLTAELRDITAPTTLITHETLCQASKEQAGGLYDLLAGFEVHLIITARDVTRQVPAEWQQQIKSRRTITYDDFLASLVEGGPETEYFWRAQDAADIADRWRQDLPPDRIHVVTVPPRGTEPEVLLDRFASVLGVDSSTLSPERERLNVTLGKVQTELLRRVNVALRDRLPVVRAGYSRVAKVHLADRVLAAQGGERLRVPERLSSWCQERAEQIVSRLQAAGYDVVGDLCELLPTGSAFDASRDSIDDGAVAAAAIEALAAMLDQRNRDLQRIDRLRRTREHGRQPLWARATASAGRFIQRLRRRLRSTPNEVTAGG
jgi:hypothetical protein